MNALRNLFSAVGLTLSVVAHAGWFDPVDSLDIVKFQPPTVTGEIPSDVRGFNPQLRTIRSALERLQPIVTTYAGDGNLIASWTPRKEAWRKPTIIFVHGGHGLGNSDLSNARWAMEELDANVLVLDSFLSRGIQENWKTETRYGANMRVLDLIAAGRFVRSEVGSESPLVVVGGSQGGWTVLRAFTESNPVNREVRELFSGGVAVYPNCRDKKYGRDEFLPPLGTKYSSPVTILTGSLDIATPIHDCDAGRVLKTAAKWIHIEGATHGWDTPPSGQKNAKGEHCSFAQNVYNHFPICYNQAATDLARKEITELVDKFVKVKP